MQSLCGQDMGLDPAIERHQCGACRTDLVSECRQAQGHALASKAFGLPVEGLVLSNFSNSSMARKPGPPIHAARRGMVLVCQSASNGTPIGAEQGPLCDSAIR